MKSNYVLALQSPIGLAQCTENAVRHSPLNSTFPVLVPLDRSLLLSDSDFQCYLERTFALNKEIPVRPKENSASKLDNTLDKAKENEASEVTEQTESTVGTEAVSELVKAPFKQSGPSSVENTCPQKSQALNSPYTTSLLQHPATADRTLPDNKMRTENSDITNISSLNPLVDLFHDMLDAHGKTLHSLLESAWKEDPLITLRIIFYSRSIHLGQGNQGTTYRALAWLAYNHPLTFFKNLQWLVKPVIEKKKVDNKKTDSSLEGVKGKEEAKADKDDDFDIVGANEAVEDGEVAAVQDEQSYDVLYGMSHGYWKDLLNILALFVEGEFRVDGDVSKALIDHPQQSGAAKRKREFDPDKAKEIRNKKVREQNEKVSQILENDKHYRALHVTVARLFGAQLKKDIALLRSGKKPEHKRISLAAKWAPSAEGFHDKTTFVLSSIAEVAFPDPTVFDIAADPEHREEYLRRAREELRRTILSPLRKALYVVERDIAANKFEAIKYERVPSLAMNRYSGLFIEKDQVHFTEYLKQLSEGKTTISGAVLLPSTLVNKALGICDTSTDIHPRMPLKFMKIAKAQGQGIRTVLNGQWNTLVDRVRASGTLASSIAVCDVSGSMSSPRFKDGTAPMDSSIGLSLLISQVTEQPFGGTIITFHEEPSVIEVGGPNDTRDFVEKAQAILRSPWGGSTDFVAVFEKLILPMAIQNQIKPEDMVKQVFVFSDMQFNQVENGWSYNCVTQPDRTAFGSSYGRIRQAYLDAGYEMPKLIFWNLASGREHGGGKPVTVDDNMTVLVRGYSQGMLKVLLETGGFDGEEIEEIEEEDVVDEDDVVEVKKKNKEKVDPLIVVMKALSHRAYDMLTVVD
ncbi:hypothetical protein GQ43DRAFT_448772 [Delitschia confertaspora ATCC 74209]|uniref:Uncharacterized protein n=1 Tax=Delitschia confertaspora ATCC 74209 TaxID=1513339 RepID=A0A9P4JLG3_9PLEO|nr:hypothetical protein GQ43DRAFT_448772 [Delitschia confertaspora ATCC 74209]